MPLLDYKCTACGRTSTFLTRAIGQQIEPACSACGSKDMARVISGFAYHRSTKDIHEAAGPPGADTDWRAYSDPRNIGRHVEDTFHTWDVDMPRQVRESIDAARDGVMPKEVDI